jgi:hypothetical protein
MKSEGHDKWMKAMENEITSMNTWELTMLLKGKKAIERRWTFKLKKDSEGRIERYEARFCAKGFRKVEGIDFTETFAPVAKMNSIRLILSKATTHDLHHLSPSLSQRCLRPDLFVFFVFKVSFA